MIRKLPSGRWQVDLWTNGRGSKRIRKSFASKAEAKRFEAFVESQRVQGQEWNPGTTDKRTLKDLIDLWFNAKGVHLKDGERRKRALEVIADSIGNPIGRKLKPSQFLAYRAEKLEGGASAKTMNNHLGYLNAVYNQLARLSEIDFENPLRNVEMIRIDEYELSWLTTGQIRHLLDTIERTAVNPHLHLLVRICLATGARWGEAESLLLRHVRNGKITYVKTKSSKSRSVPIREDLYLELQLHLRRYKRFTSSINAFRRAVRRSGIELPKGQSSHVLRHTFASHFVMNGGDILTLQKILGHSTIMMTMRYAHLSPNHLDQAKQLNPLNF